MLELLTATGNHRVYSMAVVVRALKQKVAVGEMRKWSAAEW